MYEEKKILTFLCKTIDFFLGLEDEYDCGMYDYNMIEV